MPERFFFQGFPEAGHCPQQEAIPDDFAGFGPVFGMSLIPILRFRLIEMGRLRWHPYHLKQHDIIHD